MYELLIESVCMNHEITRVIMQGLSYGLLAGIAFFIFPWGTRLALSLIRT